MKRFLLLLPFCLFAIGQVWADVQTINGKVLNAADEEPIVGASIVVKGTNQGTISDVDGNFTVRVEQGATLMVSFIGMHTVEVAAQNDMKVLLSEDTQILDEVVAIGYGTVTRAQFVGSAAEVGGEQITKQATSNVTNALQGKMAGVQVVNGSGQPGTGASIRIRGIGSINGGTTPLYIVDGAPYEEGNINMISPYDIESMTVLKDAAATAIYGARGANGVVLITTKSGNNESKLTVNVDAKWGNSQRAVPNYDVMTDPAMYLETAYKALYNSQVLNAGLSAAEGFAYADKTLFSNSGVGYQIYTVPDGERVIGTNFKLNPHATLGYTDGKYFYTPDNWEKNTLKTNNLRHEYNINVNGGNKDTQYFMSAGYLSDPGIIDGSSFERFTLRSRVESQVKKWLKIGLAASYAHTETQNPGSQTNWGSSGNLFYTMNNMAPIYPFFVRDADGNIVVDGNGYTVYDTGTNTGQTRSGNAPKGNNAINVKIDDNKSSADVFSGSFFLTLTPVEGFNLTARVSPDVVNVREHAMSNPFYGSASSGGIVDVDHVRMFNLNQQYLANYKKSFADVHKIEVLAGWEQYLYKEQYLFVENDHMYNPFIPEIGNTYGAQPVSGQTSSYTMTFSTAGLMARVQYDLMDRYFLNATYRFEGSSRFSKENRWGHFGSVGAAWLINREGFLADVSEIDELKLKASWGTQGNDQIGSGIGAFYAYQDLYSISYNSETGEFSKVLSLKGNPDLTWEKQMLSNVGVEFSFFKNRLGGSVEYYNRINSDMLFSLAMPPSAGFASLRQNVGQVDNNGVEVELDGVILDMRNVKWSINANLTFNKSKIVSLPDIYKESGLKSSSYILKEGGSLIEGYLPMYAGVDSQTGAALYYVDPDNEASRDKSTWATTTDYSSAKQADLGDLSAKVFGGFGTTLEAYGVDLSLSCSYQLGGKAYDGGYQELMHTGAQIGRNWHKDILNAWQQPGDQTNIPRLSSADDNNQQTCDRWLVSSNYLGLNNLTLGYTLPAKVTKKIQLQKVRFFFQGDNLGLWSARRGFDPRQSQNAFGTGLGIATNSGNFVYSQLRTLSGGVSITF